MKIEHEIPVHQNKFLLGRVKHHIDTPLDYRIKIIKEGILKKISFPETKEVFIIDDDTAKKIIETKWEDYVKNTYKKRGSRAKKEIVEHPIQLDKSLLKKFTQKIINIGSVKYYFPTEFINQKKTSFLEKCDEISSKVGDIKIRFNREELYDDII